VQQTRNEVAVRIGQVTDHSSSQLARQNADFAAALEGYGQQFREGLAGARRFTAEQVLTVKQEHDDKLQDTVVTVQKTIMTVVSANRLGMGLPDSDSVHVRHFPLGGGVRTLGFQPDPASANAAPAGPKVVKVTSRGKQKATTVPMRCSTPRRCFDPSGQLWTKQ
jgi:hypothetical protein